MYRFEWNYDEIKNQRSLNNLVDELKAAGTMVNYEQAARLFYTGKHTTFMVELQIPTREMVNLIENESISPWFDVYKVENMEDYNADHEIYTTIDNPQVITFDNAERLMLELAERLEKLQEE